MFINRDSNKTLQGGKKYCSLCYLHDQGTTGNILNVNDNLYSTYHPS